MTSLPYRRPSRQGSRQASTDPREDLQVHLDHFIGIDVGTGSARACIIDAKGDIVGLASENIGLWQPEHGYYVRAPCNATHRRPLTRVPRNNRLPTSGGVSALQCSAPSVSIISVPRQCAALDSMLPARCPCLTMKPMSRFQ